MRLARVRLLMTLTLLIPILAPPSGRAGGFGGVLFDTFSIDPLSPEAAAFSAADVFIGGFPAIFRPFGAFGLLQAEDIDAITFGGAGKVTCPPGNDFYQLVFFSVGRGSMGAPGLGDAITFEVGVDGASGDIFVQRNNGGLKGRVALVANAGFRFGVGRVLGLTNGPPPPAYSNVDAWSGGGPAGNLALMPLLFSVGPAAGARIGVSSADILLNDPLGAPWAVAIPFGALGLLVGDDIDALDASSVEVRAPRLGDRIYFSLKDGSPTLALIPANASDILYFDLGMGGLPLIWSPAAAHGLKPTDELDALDIWDPGFQQLTDDGGFLEYHAGHRCSWPVPIDVLPSRTEGEPVVERAASIPSPANCTVDQCLLACPGGDVRFNIIVRDLANNRLAGSVVDLNFTGCPDFVPCETGNTYTVDWQNRSIRMSTDFAGVASFQLRGGGSCAPGTVEIRADGTFLASRALSSPDLDASLMVDGVDRLLLSALEGSAGPEGDFDCGGLVSGAFDPNNPPPPPPLLDAPATTPTANRLTARLLSHPVRAGANATLTIGTRSAGTVTADLHDLLGRRLERTVFEATLAGTQQHTYRVPANLAAGVYSMRFRSGSEATSIRIVVLGR